MFTILLKQKTLFFFINVKLYYFQSIFVLKTGITASDPSLKYCLVISKYKINILKIKAHFSLQGWRENDCRKMGKW